MTEDPKLKSVQQLIVIMVRAIVRNPDMVDTYASEAKDELRGDFILINVKVAKEDIPTCIGRGGTTAESIRRIALVASKRAEYGRHIFVRIDAPPMPENHYYGSKGMPEKG